MSDHRARPAGRRGGGPTSAGSNGEPSFGDQTLGRPGDRPVKPSVPPSDGASPGRSAARQRGAGQRTSGGTPSRSGRDQESRPRPQVRAGQTRDREARQVQPPPEADPRLLDPEVRRALRSLTTATADRVAAHLVAVAQLLDVDPRAALLQAHAARALASRIGLVREAAGLAAYAAGEWHEALAELRAERRLTGSIMHLAVMADCQRGLGRPEQALSLASSPEAAELDETGRAELAIVAAGARRDMGQADAALTVLESAGLDRANPMPWSPRLWYAYADALLAAGRQDEARSWFALTTEIDDGETDAEERLLVLTEPPSTLQKSPPFS